MNDWGAVGTNALIGAGAGAIIGGTLGLGLAAAGLIGGGAEAATAATVAGGGAVAAAEAAPGVEDTAQTASTAAGELTDSMTTLYHGSINNATNILQNGLDIFREGATYVSTDNAAAQDAINYRLTNFPQEVTDPGIITSNVPTSLLQQLQASGDIISRSYQGFSGSSLNTTEILLTNPVAKEMFNNGIVK